MTRSYTSSAWEDSKAKRSHARRNLTQQPKSRVDFEESKQIAHRVPLETLAALARIR